MLRTNRQTDKQTDSKILPTPTDIVGVGNERMFLYRRKHKTFESCCRTAVNCAGGPGPAGAQGVAGFVGLPGPAGGPGATGWEGRTGVLGSVGATGQRGRSGDTGFAGSTGQTGLSLICVLCELLQN